MSRRRRKKTTKLGDLASNRKIQVLFLFALLIVGVLASLGAFPAQNVYGYDTRAHAEATVYIKGPYGGDLYELSSLVGVEFPGYKTDKIQSGFALQFEGWDAPPKHPYTGFMECWTSNENQEYVTLISKTGQLSLSGTHYEIEGGNYRRYYATTDSSFNPTGSSYVGTPWVWLKRIAYEQGTNLFKFKIVVTDVDGVTDTYEIFTSVVGPPPSEVDNSAPLFISKPVDPYTYTVDTIGHTLEWSLVEDNPATYIVTTDGVAGSEVVWTDVSLVSVNIDGLSIGTHTVVVTFSDVNGNTVEDSVEVIVYSTLALSSPDDIEFDVGTTGHVIYWDVDREVTPSIVVTGTSAPTLIPTYSGGQVYVDVSSLDVGEYDCELTVVDGEGLSTSDVVHITVTNVGPGMSSPSDVSFEVGVIGQTIWWDFSESVTAILVITGAMSDTQYPSTDGNHVEIILDGLTIGEYDYTLTIEDYDGATNTDVVQVSVLEESEADVTSPTITHPGDISEVGSVVDTISWTITDETSGTYVIERDGSQVATGNWEDGDVITYDVSESTVGSYMYEIICVDEGNNEVRDEVDITITAVKEEPEPIPIDLGEYGIYLIIGVVVVLMIFVGRRRRG